MTGGETQERAEIIRLRSLILHEEDVLAVLALSYVPTENRWAYLIKTPFATWPKYVVGWTDKNNAAPEHLLRCGHEAGAREYFDEINEGGSHS